jgi:hypothetical protein
VAVAHGGDQRSDQELDVQLEVDRGHEDVVDDQFDEGAVLGADALAGQLDHLGAARLGGGAASGGGEVALFAPARDHQVPEVEVDQAVGGCCDLVVDRPPP